MSDTPAPALASLKKLFPGLTEAEYATLDAWYAGYAALSGNYETVLVTDEATARALVPRAVRFPRKGASRRN